MYQLISAIGIAKDFDGQYYPIDLTTMPLNLVFLTYTNVIATVIPPSSTLEVGLDLFKLPLSTRLLSQTFPQFLMTNQNRTLPTEPLPTITYQYVGFKDLWQWNFSVAFMNRKYHPDYELSDDLKTDLLLSKPTADYVGLSQHYLFTVNGFIHRAEYLPQGIVVYDAHVSKQIANNTQLGGLDFSQIGSLEYVDLTKDLIYERNPGQPYSQAVYLKLPKQIGPTTPLLVLGGYLHALDDLYSMVSDDVLKIDFAKYPWINRYFTLRHQLNLDALGVVPNANGAYEIDALTSNEVIASLIDLSQTFLVLVNTTELRKGLLPIHFNGLPGVYETSIKPFAPMVIDDGRLTEYAVSTEHGRHALRVEHYLTDRRVLETTHYLAYQNTAPLNVSEKPKAYADAYFLLLSKTVGD